VATDSTGQVLGWIAAAAVSWRQVYAGVIEHSVYVADAARGHGIATLLLHALIESSEEAGIWTLQCGVFPENTASLALHASAGFRVVGTRERLASTTVAGVTSFCWNDVAGTSGSNRHLFRGRIDHAVDPGSPAECRWSRRTNSR
jgi:L-amino acid N-acyltransferase YncA